MAQALVIFLASATVIIVAGVFLARFADEIAESTGLGKLLIGGVLLAGATSLPELVFGLNAVRMGAENLAISDFMGACVFNLLILAIGDLMSPSRGRLFSRESAAHALSGSTSIALVASASFAILFAPHWGFSILGQDPGVLMTAGIYALAARMIFFDQRVAQVVRGATTEGDPAPRPNLRQAVIGFLVAASVVVATGPFLASSAERIADLSGMGTTFVGATLVALSTTLPELVATITAVRIGAFDLAVGNIFGSNAFNMLLLLPLDIAHPGPLFLTANPTNALTGLGTILISCIVVTGQLYQVEKRWKIIEPDALLVIAVAFLTLLAIFVART